MEIVSPADKSSVLAAQVADYRSVNVQEVWVVRAEAKTIEVIRLSPDEIETTAEYERGQTVRSLAFPDLEVALDDLFMA